VFMRSRRHGSLAGTRAWGDDVCKYDEMQKCVVVPALGNVPLQWVSRAMFVAAENQCVSGRALGHV